MVHRLVVEYGQPLEPDQFDQHYTETHAKLARKMPGLLKYTIGHAQPVGGGSAPYAVAELDFESAEAMAAALESPEGRTAVGDLPNFATGTVTLMSYDVEDITR